MGNDSPGDYADSQYSKPAVVQDAYANEGDPSWEDVIAMVVIPGSPARIKQAADEWSALLSRLGEVERVLNAIKADLETWKGPGGEEYRNHLATMLTSIQTVREDHTNLPHYLHLAAGDLETAVAKIPIPDDMIHEVMAAKQGYIDSGMISGVWGPNAIYQHLLPLYGNKWLDEAREFFTWDWAEHKLRDWISSQDNVAKDAYHALAKQHVRTMDSIPGTNPVDYADPRAPALDPNSLPGGGGGGGLGAGGMPSGKMPGSNASIPGGPSSSFNPEDMTGPGGIGDPSLGDTGGPGGGYNPDDIPGGGLAGVGGGGLTGAGPGAGGLGPGMGGGAGSGLGAGGLGAGGLPRGAGGGMGAGAGGMGGMMPGMGGAGAGRGGAGRGVSGAGAGKGGVRGAGAGAGRGAAGGARGGMMPGAGGGAGHGGEGEDHTTWLQEDDDPWGSDSEAPPSVLG